MRMPKMTILAMVVLVTWLLLGPNRRDSFASQDDDPIVQFFVINLDSRPDKMRAFEAMWANATANTGELVRISGIDGRTVDVSEVCTPRARRHIERGYRTHHSQLTPGAVGCYLSHLKAWRECAESKAQYCVVFEDDAIIGPDFHRGLAEFVKGGGGSRDDERDMVLLGSEIHEKDGSRVIKFYELHAYLVTPDSAARLSKACGSRRISRQLDTVLSDLAREAVVRVVEFPGKIAWQTHETTEVQNECKGC